MTVEIEGIKMDETQLEITIEKHGTGTGNPAAADHNPRLPT